MRRLLIVLFGSVVFTATIWAGDKDKNSAADPDEPIAFGTVSNQSGCVIFKEVRKTSTKFYGPAMTMKAVNELELVEAQNYKLDQKLWKEDKKGMDELERIAAKDKIKFVKIPSKEPTEEQLARAREMCKESIEPF